MPAVTLVTGATGFAGSHLLDLLLASGEAVTAWANPAGTRPPAGDRRIDWQAVSLLDRDAVAARIAELRPAVVYHLGGAADVGGAWQNPAGPLRLNALGTHYLLEAVRAARLECTVLVTGSAFIYRQSPNTLDEESPVAPSTPYGVSKLAQEMVAARATWCRVLLARPFNHAGPRQSPAYATSSFARQIAEIEAGIRPPVLRVGNLESRRDITDVRDTVRAYRALVASGTPGRPYNVCSGQAYRIADLLERLTKLAAVHVRIDVDPARLRPSDTPTLLGDASRLHRDTGWRPEIPIDRTLADLLDYWRHQTKRTAAPGL